MSANLYNKIVPTKDFDTFFSSIEIADNILVVLTLMIAESKTEEKGIMVKVVVNLINKNNL